ncbi:MAG TPA: TonB-dependent receptor [Puia sp.]|nr:TonB-dependent receptor [Puia sp.]
MRYLLLPLLLLYSTVILAGEEITGSIKGKITTSDHRPAESVSVILSPGARGTITDENGEFTFHKIKPGSYKIAVSFNGYETQEQTVIVEGNKTHELNFQLRLSEKQLQEVIVTLNRNPYTTHRTSPSLRLNEPLLEVPQNIQVITAKALADQQVISMSDGVLRNVSGAVRLEHWADMYTNVFMRGSRVSAFRNGMNVVMSYWSPLTEDMSIVDHIDFVKGPSGFMMAVGDPAGFYNVATKKPTGVTKGEVGIMMGSYDLYRGNIDLDGKLDSAGRLLYRFNAMGQTKNSFRPYEYNNRYLASPVLTYKLDDKSTITAEFLYQKVKTSDVGSYYVFSPKGYGVLPRNFTTADPGLEPTYMTDQSLTLNFQHKFDDHWKLTVQGAYFSYKQQGTDLWPAYVGADSMIRGVSNWDVESTGKFGQAFLNGDIQTGSIQHRIIIGVDGNSKEYWADWNQYHTLDTEEEKFSIYNPVYGSPSNGYPVWDRSSDIRQRAGQWGHIAQSYTGVYVQDELGFFNNRLRVTLAGRYTYVKNLDGDEATAKKFTPRLGLSYSIDHQTSVYALYDQALVPQSGIRKDGGTVQPLTGNNTELGIKRNWADGRWTTSLSAYRILRNNENASDPGDPTGKFIVQLGQTRATGIEFDLRGEIVRGLTLTANYAYTDSKITKADTSKASQGTIGNKVPGYAEHTANAWLNYQIGSGVLKGLGISAGATFLGHRNMWEWGTSADFLPLPDYTKLDGGIFWEQNKIRVSLNVFNLADKYLYSGAAYDTYYYYQAEPGRNWRLGMTYKF